MGFRERQCTPLNVEKALSGFKASGLATVFFEQLDVVDGHATVHGLAHVINCEQRHLHSGESFHLYPGWADSLNRCST